MAKQKNDTKEEEMLTAGDPVTNNVADSESDIVEENDVNLDAVSDSPEETDTEESKPVVEKKSMVKKAPVEKTLDTQVRELRGFVRYLSDRALPPAEQTTVRDLFPAIFKD